VGAPCRLHLGDRRGWRLDLGAWWSSCWCPLSATPPWTRSRAAPEASGSWSSCWCAQLDVGEQLAALREEIDARYAEIISNDGDTILADTFTLLSERVGADNLSISGGLDVFVDRPTETIDPENRHLGCWSGWRDGSLRRCLAECPVGRCWLSCAT
jgi:hypothetical protein